MQEITYQKMNNLKLVLSHFLTTSRFPHIVSSLLEHEDIQILILQYIPCLDLI